MAVRYCEKHKAAYGENESCPDCASEAPWKFALAILTIITAIVFGLLYKVPKYIADKSDEADKTRNVVIYFLLLIAIIGGMAIYINTIQPNTARVR